MASLCSAAAREADLEPMGNLVGNPIIGLITTMSHRQNGKLNTPSRDIGQIRYFQLKSIASRFQAMISQIVGPRSVY